MARSKKDPERATEQEETQNVVIPLPKTLHRQLRFLSVDRGQPMNALIVEAVATWWERQPEFTKFPSDGGGSGRMGRPKKV